MKLKDSTVISLLAFTWILIAIGVIGADSEIAKLEQSIQEVYGDQASLEDRVKLVEETNLIQDGRLDDIEHHNKVQDFRLAMHHDELSDNAELFTDLLNSVEHLEEYMRSLPDNALGVTVSDEDIRDIAALVYLEAGSQSYTCQKAIASVIFNRMIRYNMTAQQVIHQSNVFSPASRVDSTRPSASCLMAVREVLEEGTTLPRSVVAFRNGHYHNFGRRYCVIDGVYFTAM